MWIGQLVSASCKESEMVLSYQGSSPDHDDVGRGMQKARWIQVNVLKDLEVPLQLISC